MEAYGEPRGTARYFQALREHWPFIAATILLAVGAALVYLSVAEKRYDAHADIVVTPVSGDDETFIGIPVIRESGESRSVLTVARFLQTPQLAEAVRRRLNLAVDRDELLDMLEVTPQEQSNIVTVTARAESPAAAARLANAAAMVLVERRTAQFQRELRAVVGRLAARLRAVGRDRSTPEAVALSERLGELQPLLGAPDPTLQIASRAVAPNEQSWPRPALSIAVAALVGVLLGMGVAVGLEMLNPLVLSEDDLLAEQLPVVARVPRLGRDSLADGVQRRRLPREIADAHRILLGNLAVASGGTDQPHAVLVTAADERRDTTAVSVALALTYAATGGRTIVVDAHFDGPAVRGVFGLPQQARGLASVLLDELTVEQALVSAPRYGDRIRLLLPGIDDRDLVDSIHPQRLDGLVAELKLQADAIVIAAPPAADVGHALALAAAVDAVLIVVRLARTRRDRLVVLQRTLAQRGVTPVGCVVVTRRAARRDREASVAPEPRRERLPT